MMADDEEDFEEMAGRELEHISRPFSDACATTAVQQDGSVPYKELGDFGRLCFELLVAEGKATGVRWKLGPGSIERRPRHSAAEWLDRRPAQESAGVQGRDFEKEYGRRAPATPVVLTSSA